MLMVTAPPISVISVISVMSVSRSPLFAASLFVAATARIVVREEALRTPRRRHRSRNTHARDGTRDRSAATEGGRTRVSQRIDSGSPMMMVMVVMMMMMVTMTMMMMMVHRCTSR